MNRIGATCLEAHTTCARAGAEQAGSEVLVNAAERLALVTLERLVNVMYGCTGPASMRVFYNYDRTRCWVFVRFKRVLIPNEKWGDAI